MVGEFVVGAVVGAVTVVITATGQKTNTKTRRKQGTPTRDREKMDNPLHAC